MRRRHWLRVKKNRRLGLGVAAPDKRAVPLTGDAYWPPAQEAGQLGFLIMS
jgi:hypothetical protein